MAAAHPRCHLDPEDLAAAYKQLLQVERGWRDMKVTLGYVRSSPVRNAARRPRFVRQLPSKGILVLRHAHHITPIGGFRAQAE